MVDLLVSAAVTVSDGKVTQTIRLVNGKCRSLSAYIISLGLYTSGQVLRFLDKTVSL
jgi:hypothetical protein